MNVATLVQGHARRRGDALALTDGERELSYAQLWRAAGRTAARLRDGGVGPGDAVVLVAANCLEFGVLYLAALRIGAVLAPLNVRLAPADIAALVARVEPALCVATREHLHALGRPGVALDDLVDADARAGGELPDPPYPAAGEHPSTVLFTSGTSALPKGATLTHANVLASCANIVAHELLDARTRQVIALPLFHTAGMHSQLTPAWYVGGAARVLERWDADAFARELRDHDHAVSFVLNPQWSETLDALGEVSLPPRHLLTGAAAVPVALLDRFERAFGTLPGFTMGMTEASPQLCYLHPDELRGKNGAIGWPTTWAEIRLCAVDGDEGREVVASGEVGELRVRGPLVMRGYWGQPRETAAAFDRQGWFRTGDLAARDADGCLYIVDRIKDIVRSGGENVYCVEVERVIAQHPAVAEVAVVGTPHARWGEGVTAAVVCHPGDRLELDELQRFCSARLASFKKPVALHLLDALPRGASGKIAKRELREQLSRTTAAGLTG